MHLHLEKFLSPGPLLCLFDKIHRSTNDQVFTDKGTYHFPFEKHHRLSCKRDRIIKFLKYSPNVQ